MKKDSGGAVKQDMSTARDMARASHDLRASLNLDRTSAAQPLGLMDKVRRLPATRDHAIICNSCRPAHPPLCWSAFAVSACVVLHRFLQWTSCVLYMFPKQRSFHLPLLRLTWRQ